MGLDVGLLSIGKPPCELARCPQTLLKTRLVSVSWLALCWGSVWPCYVVTGCHWIPFGPGYADPHTKAFQLFGKVLWGPCETFAFCPCCGRQVVNVCWLVLMSTWHKLKLIIWKEWALPRVGVFFFLLSFLLRYGRGKCVSRGKTWS